MNAANAMVMFVTTPSNGTISIDTQPSDTTEIVQQLIQAQTGIDPSIQILAYGGRTLELGQNLSYYNILHTGTIHLTILQQSQTYIPDPAQRSKYFLSCLLLHLQIPPR